MTFQIHALPYAGFAPLFALDDAALAAQNTVRRTVAESPGIPCRVSLADADVGETVILLNHMSLPEASPYRATHAIYVRQDAVQAHPAPGEVPKVLARRLLSVRSFDADHMMIAADVTEGRDLAGHLDAAFGNPATAYIHLHNARAGCFAARATRA